MLHQGTTRCVQHTCITALVWGVTACVGTLRVRVRVEHDTAQLATAQQHMSLGVSTEIPVYVHLGD